MSLTASDRDVKRPIKYSDEIITSCALFPFFKLFKKKGRYIAFSILLWYKSNKSIFFTKIVSVLQNVRDLCDRVKASDKQGVAHVLKGSYSEASAL